MGGAVALLTSALFGDTRAEMVSESVVLFVVAIGFAVYAALKDDA
jgi:hypothetical protein